VCTLDALHLAVTPPAPTAPSTLSLHDALPIWGALGGSAYREFLIGGILAQTLTFNSSFTAVYLAKDLQSGLIGRARNLSMRQVRSEEHTSELQSRFDLVCRLLLEKKKRNSTRY